MDKYQVYHYFKYYEPDNTTLFWSYAGLTFILICSITIPLYLQYTTIGDVPTGEAISENYVQWHLEQEIKQIKAKTRRKRKNKKRSSLSTDEEF